MYDLNPEQYHPLLLSHVMYDEEIRLPRDNNDAGITIRT